MKKVPLSEVKDDLSRYLRLAATEEIVITRHGKPAGVLIGFESEDDWLEYRLENDARFLHRAGRRPGSAPSPALATALLHDGHLADVVLRIHPERFVHEAAEDFAR